METAEQLYRSHDIQFHYTLLLSMAKQTHILKAACNIDSLNHNCPQIHRFHVHVRIHWLLIAQSSGEYCGLPSDSALSFEVCAAV
jgi:hypothetical protein